LFSAAMAAAQNPSGSYQQTCRNIHVSGSTLKAKCDSGNGSWHDTQLRNYQSCSSDIQNLHGQLQCTMGQGAVDNDRDNDNDRGNGNIPQGSYTQTCQNISVSGNTLHASCKKGNGHMHNSSLRNFQSCPNIENDNGKLRCRR
jgi:hypothetical protein